MRVVVKYTIKEFPLDPLTKEPLRKDGIRRTKIEPFHSSVKRSDENILALLQRHYKTKEIKLLSVDWAHEIPEEKGLPKWIIPTPMYG